MFFCCLIKLRAVCERFFPFFFPWFLLWGSGMPPNGNCVETQGFRLDTKPKSVAPGNDPKKDQRPGKKNGLLGSVDSQLFFFWYPEMVGLDFVFVHYRPNKNRTSQLSISGFERIQKNFGTEHRTQCDICNTPFKSFFLIHPKLGDSSKTR